MLTITDFYKYGFYYSPSDFAEKNLIVSDGMGYINDKEFIIERKSFFNNVVMYVIDGVMHVEQNGQNLTLHKNQGVIMPLTIPHKYYSDENFPAHLLWFHFRGNGSKQLINHFSNQDILPYYFENENLSDNFIKLFTYSKEKNLNEFLLSSTIYEILMIIFSKVKLNNSLEADAPAILKKLVRYMDFHISDSLSLDDFSSYLNINKSYLCRIFSKHYGISPMQYYTKKKMGLACDLLKKTTKSIDDIAVFLGYSNPAYFSKYFKEYFGISPSSYRNDINF